MKHEEYTKGEWIVVQTGPHPYVTAPNPDPQNQSRITITECQYPVNAAYKHQRIANARLIADSPNLVKENERLRAALEAITGMVINEKTNYIELSILCIFIAKEALEGRE